MILWKYFPSLSYDIFALGTWKKKGFIPSFCNLLFHVLNAAAAAKLLQSCLTLCDSIDSSPSGSSVPGILQARILEWVAISFSNAYMHAKSLQSCPTLVLNGNAFFIKKKFIIFKRF